MLIFEKFLNQNEDYLMKELIVISLIVVLFILSGCASTQGSKADGSDASVEDRSGQAAEGYEGQAAEGYEGQTGGYEDSGSMGGSSLGGNNGGPSEDPNSPLSVRTIYFEYDSAVISSEGQSALTAHAEYLSLNPDQRIILEGHSDERGTREYNLALGERRAWAVEEFLSLSGVSTEQLEVRSYGEENPVSMGNDESAYQINRRVELLY
jgi:peptidoglycan-associated lipoprotein